MAVAVSLAASSPYPAPRDSAGAGGFRSEFIAGLMTGNHHRNPLPESV
jgi:hypothetical protein